MTKLRRVVTIAGGLAVFIAGGYVIPREKSREYNLQQAMDVCDRHHPILPPTEAEIATREWHEEQTAKTGFEYPPFDDYPEIDADKFQSGWELCYAVRDKWRTFVEQQRMYDEAEYETEVAEREAREKELVKQVAGEGK